MTKETVKNNIPKIYLTQCRVNPAPLTNLAKTASTYLNLAIQNKFPLKT